MRTLAVALIGVTLAGGAGVIVGEPWARLGSGYTAKIACSEIFLAGRAETAVRATDFAGISPALSFVSLTVDHEKRETRAHMFLLGASRAVYRDGYGCTLADAALAPLPAPQPVANTPLAVDRNRLGVDAAAIDAALDAAFADREAGARAMLVLHDGAIVAERYAPGFSEATPLLSWSMGKSVTATMIGAAVMAGLVDIDAPPPVPEWGENDPRCAITWRDLLQMQSGLAFSEDYGAPQSDVSHMLFRAADTGAVAAAKPLVHAPGERFSYSSGTTNLLQRALRRALEDQETDYHAFARETLFAPLGMASIVLEPDNSGVYIGSSFIYATARDWARLGQLYLDDGVFGDEGLLPEGWRDFVATPAGASDGEYGGQFWLNRKGAAGREQYIPGLPESAYLMSGHGGQYIVIIPDRRLVIVRLGMTRAAEPMRIVAPKLAAIYAAAGE